MASHYTADREYHDLQKICYTCEQLISTGVKVANEKTAFYLILVGGDQLTAVRARSALKLILNSQTYTFVSVNTFVV